jgi:hypothetical protein
MTEDTPEGKENQQSGETGLPPWNARTELHVSGSASPRYELFGFLAKAWLNELARVVPHTYGWKVAEEISYPPDYYPHRLLKHVRLENGQRVTLRLSAYWDAPRWDDSDWDKPRNEGGWFRRVEVRASTSRTDKATLSALSVLEGSGVDKAGIDRIDRRLRGEQVDLESAEARLLAFAGTLLRHHHDDLDLDSEEGIALLVKTCERVAAVAMSTQQLSDHLEFGVAGRKLRPAVMDAEMDLYAAELHHIAGLSQREVAEKLRREILDRSKEKGGHDTAASIIKRGTELFERALGEDGWQRYKRLLRDEYERSIGALGPPILK